MQNIIQQINPFNKVTLNPDYLSNFEAIFESRNTKTTDTDSNIPIFPQNEDNYDFSNIGITQCSAVDDNFWNNIKGIWEDIKDGNSKDGEIGDTSQGATGDCWLLSGVNALSYTEEGRKVISQALDYKDGYTVVHTMAGDYVVSNQEVRLTKANNQYSDGDDDMIILELAIEKIIDDVASGRVDFDANVSKILHNAFVGETGTSSGSSSTNGGNSAALIYMLTGKVATRTVDAKDIADALEQFEQNHNKDMTITCGFRGFKNEENKTESYVVKDVYGNDVTLVTSHAFAVKNVCGDNITITNPWDTANDIVISKDVFLEYCSDVEVCDLSASNPKQDLFSPKMYYNKDGNISKTIDTDKHGNTKTYQYNYNKSGDLTDIECNANYIDGRYANYKWDSQGNCTYAKNGNKDSNIALVRHYDDEGNVTEAMLGETDSNGNLKYTFSEMTPEIADRILDADLLRCENLSAKNIFSLAKNLSDADFTKAVEYLKSHTDATYQEIMDNI